MILTQDAFSERLEGARPERPKIKLENGDRRIGHRTRHKTLDRNDAHCLAMSCLAKYIRYLSNVRIRNDYASDHK